MLGESEARLSEEWRGVERGSEVRLARVGDEAKARRGGAMRGEEKNATRGQVETMPRRVEVRSWRVLSRRRKAEVRACSKPRRGRLEAEAMLLRSIGESKARRVRV